MTMGKTLPYNARPSYLASPCISFPGWVRVVLPVVPESAAPNRVDNDEEDEEYDVDGGNLLPVILQVSQHSSLA